MPDLTGETIGRYRVLDKLGAGGMGVVYKALDQRLDREVAIKVLPEEVADEADRVARFELEAKAVARLDHPNILAIHDFGTEGGVAFAVTELLVGENLRETIVSGTLTPRKVLEVGQQIATGLAAAHEKGIIHRDLKPENIFLTTDGRVKILDFGLTKLTRPETDGVEAAELPTEASPTAVGAVLGTPGYVSPEQLRGKPTDARSDIFALGVVLYEMLNGTRPFAGRTPDEISAAILKDDPAPVSEPAVKIAPGLGSIVSHCLEKRPEERFQSARDLVFALKAASSQTSSRGSVSEGSGVRSIAVLPFEVTGGAEELEYLGDGLTEGIIGRLCGLPGIDRVIARHSVFRYKGRTVDPQTAGTELGVDTVLVGDITSRGHELWIAAELITVDRGARIWGKRYVRQFSDIIDLEDAISQAIAESLRLELSDEDHARMVKRPTDDTEAYRLYLKGRHLCDRRTREALERSIELFREAISHDPRFALAYTGIADAWALLSWNDLVPKATAFKEALSSVLTSLDIDDQVAESHVSLGIVLYNFGTDWARAEKEFRRALEINRNNAEAYHQYAHLLTFLTRTDEAIEMMSRAVELEPVSRIISSCCGQVHYFAGRYDDAIFHLETAIELDPAIMGPYSWLGMVHIQRQEWKAAERALRRGLDVGTFRPRNTGALGYCKGIQGNRDEALDHLKRLEELSAEGPIDPCFEAWIHAGIGASDSAIAALERAYAQDANWLVSLQVDPFFAGLRADSRFQDLLQRMNFRKAQ
jgi:TolB-like protein/tetratricopeptide (TPR) repeat protein